VAKVTRLLRGTAIALVVLGLASSIGLLARDEGMGVLPQLSRGAMTAMPLLSVGIAFLILQLMIRPRSKELLKNLQLAANFMLWGVIQLMPRNTLSLRLGRVVIAIFVLELAWVILLSLRPTQESMQARAHLQVGAHRGKS
jgi:hypothetical protein